MTKALWYFEQSFESVRALVSVCVCACVRAYIHRFFFLLTLFHSISLCSRVQIWIARVSERLKSCRYVIYFLIRSLYCRVVLFVCLLVCIGLSVWNQSFIHSLRYQSNFVLRSLFYLNLKPSHVFYMISASDRDRNFEKKCGITSRTKQTRHFSRTKRNFVRN